MESSLSGMSVFSLADRRKKGVVVRRARDQLFSMYFKLYQVSSSRGWEVERVSFKLSCLVVLGID